MIFLLLSSSLEKKKKNVEANVYNETRQKHLSIYVARVIKIQGNALMIVWYTEENISLRRYWY